VCRLAGCYSVWGGPCDEREGVESHLGRCLGLLFVYLCVGVEESLFLEVAGVDLVGSMGRVGSSFELGGVERGGLTCLLRRTSSPSLYRIRGFGRWGRESWDLLPCPMQVRMVLRSYHRGGSAFSNTLVGILERSAISCLFLARQFFGVPFGRPY
jgi:hypothetical protein